MQNRDSKLRALPINEYVHLQRCSFKLVAFKLGWIGIKWDILSQKNMPENLYCCTKDLLRVSSLDLSIHSGANCD
jgi:hypothetical protein